MAETKQKQEQTEQEQVEQTFDDAYRESFENHLEEIKTLEVEGTQEFAADMAARLELIAMTLPPHLMMLLGQEYARQQQNQWQEESREEKPDADDSSSD